MMNKSIRYRWLFWSWSGLLVALLTLRLLEIPSLTETANQALWGIVPWLLSDAAVVVCGSLIWLSLFSLLMMSVSIRDVMWRWVIGIGGLKILLIQVILTHYEFVAGVPLGADLWAYSLSEIITTVKGSPSELSLAEIFSITGAIGVYSIWYVFFTWTREQTTPSMGLSITTQRWVWILATCGFVWPFWSDWPAHASTHALAFFIKDQRPADWFSHDDRLLTDQAFPFAHPEQTPDTLSAFFNLPSTTPPNFIFIIVEGLGRDFSGPQARLHSFTPFLDELAKRSLYWNHFLASQGRTFAVLPSVFGSLPFGPYGTRQIEHDSMLSILKSQGYRLSYFSGSNLTFDHQGDYLTSEGVTTFYSQNDFHQPAHRVTEWGYPDQDLFELTARTWASDSSATPRLSIIQTMSMHTPFQFPGIEAYRRLVDQRLDALKVPPQERNAWQHDHDIYASILYTDEAIRQFFDQLARLPQWRNTIVVITGDHRLPEITMNTKLERYHVPLIIASPLLKTTQLMPAVSSHLDIAPSVVAMLSHHYDWETPATVSWVGSGLDTGPTFRNVHAYALKQTKSSLHDYVSGLYFLNEDQLFELDERFEPAPVEDLELKNRLKAALGEFSGSLRVLERVQRLTPPTSQSEHIAYHENERSLTSMRGVASKAGVMASQLHIVQFGTEQMLIEVSLQNNDSVPSAVFVPLVVLSDAKGNEIAEVSAQARQLSPHGQQLIDLHLPVPRTLCPPSQCFLSVVISDPQTGKPIGQGQYHVEVLARE